MIVILTKENNQYNQEFRDAIKQLEDGKYLVSVRPLVSKTKREYQEEYFLKVDILRDHTGYDRYTIHEDFKQHRQVATTKHFNEEDWKQYLEALKWWAFEKLEIVI